MSRNPTRPPAAPLTSVSFAPVPGAGALAPAIDLGGHGPAGRLLHELRNPPWRHWVCRNCREQVDGPFEQCWNCGTPQPMDIR